MVEGIGYRDAANMIEIERIIKEIDKLKPISPVGRKVLEISSNPDTSLAELVDIIKFDQVITANLLRRCNSSYFGLKRKIVSVKQAVAYLGLEKVASLVMMESTADHFKNAQGGYDLNEGELWRYSVSSALIAQDLAEKRHFKDVPLVFTSALLKDIGKIILNTYVKDALEDMLKMVENEGVTFTEAEKEIIGIDHAELGARVAEKWSFSARMVNIIRNHHDPDKAPPNDLSTPIIYLADSICMMLGIGVGADGLAYRHHQDVLDRLNFSDVDLQITIANFWEKIEGIEELLSLAG